jgi:hypothetical protein
MQQQAIEMEAARATARLAVTQVKTLQTALTETKQQLAAVLTSTSKSMSQSGRTYLFRLALSCF